MPPILRAETQADFTAVHAIHDAAFGDDSISGLVMDLRGQEAAFATVSIVAEGPNGEPVGHVMASHAFLDADTALIDVMVLSPLAVHPNHQNQGIGTALLNTMRTAIDNIGSALLFVEGNHKYFGPRGFENAMSLGFRRPSTRIPQLAFQVARLSGYNSAMTGSFVYKDVHWRHGVGIYQGG